jgi:phosphatidylserine/phosphatidylglycerophosphate/cardiolipin synthase-like enzyme
MKIVWALPALVCLVVSSAFGQASIPVATDAEHSPVRPTPQVVPADVLARAAAAAPAGDFTEALYNFLRMFYPKLDGRAFSLTKDNALETNWLVQTPNVWGLYSDKVPKNAGGFVVDDVRSLIASANTFVDITSLVPFPTGRFEDAVRDGLVSLAKNNRTVTVRIVVGWYPDPRGVNQSEYLKKIIAPLRSIKTGHLTIYVAAQRKDQLTWKGWNHAKMVAVDGQRVLLGGENLWSDDYLDVAPVHDLNLALRGSVVFGMHKFADILWTNACSYTAPAWLAVYWRTGMAQDYAYGCLAKNPLVQSKSSGSLPVLGAGRLAGLEGEPNNPADAAMAFALGSSTSTIRMAQQDLGMPGGLYWEPAMTAIARALVAQQHVYIVLTNDDAKVGSAGASYSTGVKIGTTADAIRGYVRKQPHAPTGAALTNLLCANLHLAPLRFGPSDTWPNGFAFGNHAKFFMVDDKIFYVGSENLYPSDLQEYGVFIGDAAVIRQVREQYWDKLWHYSSRAAISGSETTRCIFR